MSLYFIIRNSEVIKISFFKKQHILMPYFFNILKAQRPPFFVFLAAYDKTYRFHTYSLQRFSLYHSIASFIPSSKLYDGS